MDEMYGYIDGFSNQLRESLKLGDNLTFKAPKNKIHNVVLAGVGGSAMGGIIVGKIAFPKLEIPFYVNRNYLLPEYVNENTLFIASSNSGNTEETLTALDEAIDKGAEIACVTSGGKVMEVAKSKKLNLAVLQGGAPPRTGLGDSSTQLFSVLYQYRLIDSSYKKQILAAAKLLDKQKTAIHQKAEKIADAIVNKLPIIYAADQNEGIAMRFKQQLNENSKKHAWYNLFPEMNHNELVGWNQEYKDIAVLILRTPDDYPRNQKRIEVCKEFFDKYAASTIEIHPKGATRIEQTYYLIHLVDWISYYVAKKRGVDAIEIKAIDYLKSELAKENL
jgi:glucose/mannose-6-phosphate isomerase